MKDIIKLSIFSLIAITINAEYLYTPKGIEIETAAPACDTPTTIGEVSTTYCGSLNEEVFYAGDLDGRYIYLSLENEGVYNWSTLSYRDVLMNANSFNDGRYNVNILRQASTTDFLAVNACENKGEGWYLPSLNEFMLIVDNASSLNYSNLGILNNWYATSTESNNTAFKDVALHYGIYDHNSSKYQSSPLTYVKCARTYDI